MKKIKFKLVVMTLSIFVMFSFILFNNKTKAVISENILEPDPINGQVYIKFRKDIIGKGDKLLGKWKGLTYYSQADKRWANKLYTSTGNKNQTMKSSGCGPTCAAIVVSSAKGEILPTTMAKLAVDNGYRTASNGTSWSFFSFIADYFDFKDYYTTTSFDTAMKYLKQKNSIGSSKYYIVVSCGKGLFTNSGHYVVLTSLDDNTIQIFDSYLYKGKFDISDRKKAKVKLKGTSIYVTQSNFKKYANYRRFWIYSNDKGNAQKQLSNKEDILYVKVRTRLNVRKGPGLNYRVIDKLKNGTKVKVYETKKGFSRIGKNRWVSSKYLSKSKTTNMKNTVGKIRILKRNCLLYSKSNLTGKKYNYKKNTTVKILKNISSSVDYVKVVVTGRKAYVKTSNFK